jgi:hypothetical protein
MFLSQFKLSDNFLMRCSELEYTEVLEDALTQEYVKSITYPKGCTSIATLRSTPKGRLYLKQNIKHITETESEEVNLALHIGDLATSVEVVGDTKEDTKIKLYELFSEEVTETARK